MLSRLANRARSLMAGLVIFHEADYRADEPDETDGPPRVTPHYRSSRPRPTLRPRISQRYKRPLSYEWPAENDKTRH